MKREYFEWLWKNSSEQFLSPPFHPLNVPEKEWQKWVKQGIIVNEFIPEKVMRAGTPEFPFLRGVKLKPSLSRDLYEKGWYITECTKEELIKLHAEGTIKIHSIDKKALARQMAKQWKIKFEYRIIPYAGQMIGWKDADTPLTIDPGIMHPVSALVFNLRELHGLTSVYIISIGKTNLGPLELEYLARNGIIYKGTEDFLTDDGLPRWGDQVFPDDIPGKSSWALLTLNGKTGKYEYDSKVLELDNMETILFEHLLNNRHRIAKKQELFELLWPDEIEREDDLNDKPKDKGYLGHNLSAQVTKLNNKLKKVNGPIVLNIRRKGYRLVILDNK